MGKGAWERGPHHGQGDTPNTQEDGSEPVCRDSPFRVRGVTAAAWESHTPTPAHQVLSPLTPSRLGWGRAHLAPTLTPGLLPQTSSLDPQAERSKGTVKGRRAGRGGWRRGREGVATAEGEGPTPGVIRVGEGLAGQ